MNTHNIGTFHQVFTPTNTFDRISFYMPLDLFDFEYDYASLDYDEGLRMESINSATINRILL